VFDLEPALARGFGNGNSFEKEFPLQWYQKLIYKISKVFLKAAYDNSRKWSYRQLCKKLYRKTLKKS